MSADKRVRPQAPVPTGDDLDKDLQRLWDESYKPWPGVYQGRKFDKDLYRQKLRAYISRRDATVTNHAHQIARKEREAGA